MCSYMQSNYVKHNAVSDPKGGTSDTYITHNLRRTELTGRVAGRDGCIRVQEVVRNRVVSLSYRKKGYRPPFAKLLKVQQNKRCT